MNHPIVVIGDEATCCGFRLAGVSTHTPARGTTEAAFAQAVEHAQLVVLTQGSAMKIEPDRLRRALARERPLVVVIPAITDLDAGPDLARRMRAVLGIES